jgi:hypothetical protein
MCGTNNSAFSIAIFITPLPFSLHDTFFFIQAYKHTKTIISYGKGIYSFNENFPSRHILFSFMDKEVFAYVMLYAHGLLIKRRVQHVRKTKGVFTS